jgi:hypothetical protein
LLLVVVRVVVTEHSTLWLAVVVALVDSAQGCWLCLLEVHTL